MKKRGFEIISQAQFENSPLLGKVEYKELKLPKRATRHSAGYDFFSPFDFTLAPGQEIKVPTGIKSYMMEDEYLGIYVRSGHGFKFNIRLKNQVGIIDSDYYGNESNEGHIFIAIKNEGQNEFEIKEKDAFAQGIFHKFLLADGDDMDGETRVGGFNSTNK